MLLVRLELQLLQHHPCPKWVPQGPTCLRGSPSPVTSSASAPVFGVFSLRESSGDVVPPCNRHRFAPSCPSNFPKTMPRTNCRIQTPPMSPTEHPNIIFKHWLSCDLSRDFASASACRGSLVSSYLSQISTCISPTLVAMLGRCRVSSLQWNLVGTYTMCKIPQPHR